MGFTVASKGAPLVGLLRKFLLAAPAASAIGPASVADACRLFNTGPLTATTMITSSSSTTAASRPASSAHPQEDDDAVELKVAMLGMAKEQVKLSAYQDTLLVKWEGVKGSDGDEDPAWYSCCTNLSADAFKLDQTKAMMKDGLLMVTVPKIKVDVDLECTDIEVE